MSDDARTDEALLEAVIGAMLATDADLRAIAPAVALPEDEEQARPTLSLVVQAEQTGHAQRAVAEYALTVTLARTFRQDECHFGDLWKKVRAIFRVPPEGLPIYDEISDLIFDDIEPATTSAVEGNDISRTLAVKCWFAPL